jgi:hypothetical protein
MLQSAYLAQGSLLLGPGPVRILLGDLGWVCIAGPGTHFSLVNYFLVGEGVHLDPVFLQDFLGFIGVSIMPVMVIIDSAHILVCWHCPMEVHIRKLFVLIDFLYNLNVLSILFLRELESFLGIITLFDSLAGLLFEHVYLRNQIMLLDSPQPWSADRQRASVPDRTRAWARVSSIDWANILFRPKLLKTKKLTMSAASQRSLGELACRNLVLFHLRYLWPSDS